MKLNATRQKAIEDWKPVWEKLLRMEDTQEHWIKCKSEVEARQLRVLYYRARMYCSQTPELYARYKSVLLERQTCVVGSALHGYALVFRKHTKLYLKELLK